MRIDATYRVVTPLFCAGAVPGRAELRLPSFKGALRFWWRALAWQRCGGDLEDIRRQEDALFGSAGGGQSRLLMRLAPTSHPRETIGNGKVLTVSARNGSVVGEGARYLGYGVMEAFRSRTRGTKDGQLTRACLRAPFEFTVQLRGRDLNEAQLSSLRRALIALGTLGGMGARSRKGYGSLVLRSLCVDGVERWRPPRDIAELEQEIVDLPGDRGDFALPAFTAVSDRTRHVLLSNIKKAPVELLDLVGRELVRYRSWGRNGKTLGGKVGSERNFKDDHDLMMVTDGGQRKTHPRRIAFGLPHNYAKRKDQQIGPHDRGFDRRASPLFIHIHECGTSPVAVLSFLPARFLPKGRSAISVGGRKVAQKPEEELYRPIHGFLDRLLDPGKRKEPFTDVIEVGS